MVLQNRFGLEVRTIQAGRDYVLLVTGGEAHVGAAAVAYWDNGQVCSQALLVPSHKEEALARELACMAAGRLLATVTVVAGIHIDQATGSEIVRIVDEARCLVTEEVDILYGQQQKRK